MTLEEQQAFREEHPRAKLPETKKVEKPFSDGTFTYLDRKVAEFYMPDEAYLEDVELHQVNNRAMNYGSFWEDTARQRYALTMGYEVEQVGFIPTKGFELYSGSSPDGLICKKPGIIEIKCPFSPEIHQDYLLFEKPEDLKEYNLQYYAQIQKNLIDTGRIFCDFVSYDPRVISDYQMKILRIPKDEEMCKMLLDRLPLAVEYYIDRMNRLSNIKTIIK